MRKDCKPAHPSGLFLAFSSMPVPQREVSKPCFGETNEMMVSRR